MPAPVVSAPSFAEALRQQRLARGLTQEELAQRARLSVRAISDLERGLKQPRPSTARVRAHCVGSAASSRCYSSPDWTQDMQEEEQDD
jgi:transcriptional regulator with XRE-family HTH domain